MTRQELLIDYQNWVDNNYQYRGDITVEYLVNNYLNQPQEVEDENIIDMDEQIKNQVIKIICKSYHVTFEQLKRKNRHRPLVMPRQLIMAVLDRITNYSLAEIGRFFKKDHATVIHARKTIIWFYNNYKDYNIYINAVYTALGQDTKLNVNPPSVYQEQFPVIKNHTKINFKKEEPYINEDDYFIVKKSTRILKNVTNIDRRRYIYNAF